MNIPLSKEDKKSWAELLYTRKNYNIDMIVETTGQEKQLIERWALEEQWEKMRLSLLTSRNEQLECLYQLLGVLTQKIKDSKDKASNADAEMLLKYTRAIKNLQTKKSVSEVLDGFDEYIIWLQNADIDLAKQVGPTYDAFITDYMKKLERAA